MIRFFVLIALVILAGCSGQYRELAHTSKDDPVWQLNDGKWTFNQNDLIHATDVMP